MSLALIQYVLKGAIRDKLIIAMLVLILLTVCMSIFMASSAMIEQDQFLAVYTSGSLRILSILGLVVFAAFFVRRQFDAKDVEFLLSRPISRTKFVLSYSAALSILALVLGVACGMAMYALLPLIPLEPLLLWTASVSVEAIIMINMTLFFAMVLSSATTAVLGVLAFYVLARMMGQILGILENHTAGPVFEGMEAVMNMVSSITPRLDLMGQTSWLVYGVGESIDFTLVAIQGAIFLSLIIIAALLDLVLRQF